ncbi:MAG TPA: FtsX-like permease family protein [Mobilitalea sp.]|nr:FtsX-like permease family protein [Mobilitalea sp.]
MNIVNKLTLRQLQMNKKRTLVTIIGTIISAAMITAVATLGLSFMDLMQRSAIATGGNWHAIYKNVDKLQFQSIASDKAVKTAILSREVGYAYLEGSQNNNKPYLYIKEFSKQGYDNFPIKLLEGRLPESPNELVISEAIATNAKVDYKIGDTIELTIGQRKSTLEDTADQKLMQEYALQWRDDTVAEYLTQDSKKTYTIVGILKRPAWEYTWSPGYTVLSYLDANTVTANDKYDVSVIFHKVNNKLFKTAENISSKYGASELEYNNDLLRYYGVYKDDSVKQMLFGLSAIIMVIIVIGSVSLIYNAFAISVSERSRYLGMLSSVGATRSQKRNSVFFEGAVIGAISIPIGIASGYAGLGITYLCINPMIKGVLNVAEGFHFAIYPSSLITSILVSCVTILISTYIPARRASNISAIDAIRQVTDVKINGKQVHTLKITRILFGIEGDLGLKNLKRNKGRYKATVFSLIISMVLFLVVSTFTMYIRKSLVLTQDGINFDIQTKVEGDTPKEKEDIVKQITSQDNIIEITRIDNLNTTAMIKPEDSADFVKENKDNFLQDGKYPYQVVINVLEDPALEKYAKEVGVDMSSLTNTEQPSAIVIDTMKFRDQVTGKYVEAQAMKTKVGDKLDLSAINSETGLYNQIKPVTIAALTGKRPMGVMPLGETAGFHIIMSRSAFSQITEGVDKAALASIETSIYLNSDNSLLLQEKLEKIQNDFGVSKLYIFNVYLYKQREQQAVTVVSVFTYAFIILITAICIANIINTISTSISLRKREFAMLKSVGITPKGFNKMLNYESIFYGLKALIYGLPISFLVMYLMYRLLMSNFDFKFLIPVNSVFIAIIAVFVIVGTAMLYSASKVKKDNIIDALKQETA